MSVANKRYAEYRKSGTSWIGDIPSSWQKYRLKNTLKKRITDGPHLTPEFIDEGIPFLSVDGIQEGELVFEGSRFISKDDYLEFSKKAKPEPNDILMGKAASTGKIARVKVDFDFSIWSPLALIKIDEKRFSPSYIEYCLKSPEAQYEIDRLCTSNTQKNISMDDIPSIFVCAPNVEEQKEIARFLDRETAKIDELIQKQEKLIELLELKRQSIIYKSVTKGLNAEAPLSPSKITWIGEIPSHWIAGKVKNYFKVTLGKMLQPEQKKLSDRLVSYLRAANIQLSGADISDVKEMWLSENELKELRLTDGDVLVSEGGDVGRCCIWNSELDECYFQNSINRVRPIGKQSNKFFYYWMTFAKNTGYIDILCNKSTIAHLTAEKLSALPMVFPPIKEQDAIVDFLDKMFIKFDALISKSKLSISFLKEHRASLISAAVTGKIDVRELV